MSGLVPNSLLVIEEIRKSCMTLHSLAEDEEGGREGGKEGGMGEGGREGGREG